MACESRPSRSARRWCCAGSTARAATCRELAFPCNHRAPVARDVAGQAFGEIAGHFPGRGRHIRRGDRRCRRRWPLKPHEKKARVVMLSTIPPMLLIRLLVPVFFLGRARRRAPPAPLPVWRGITGHASCEEALAAPVDGTRIPYDDGKRKIVDEKLNTRTSRTCSRSAIGRADPAGDHPRRRSGAHPRRGALPRHLFARRGDWCRSTSWDASCRYKPASRRSARWPRASTARRD